jgi:hypothetical protein
MRRYRAWVCEVRIANPKFDHPVPFSNVENTALAELCGAMTQRTIMLAAYPKTNMAATTTSKRAKCFAPTVFRNAPPPQKATTNSQHCQGWALKSRFPTTIEYCAICPVIYMPLATPQIQESVSSQPAT